MDDGPSNIKVRPDHFQVSTTQSNNPSTSQQGTENSLRIGPIAHFGLRKLRSAGFIMNLFSLPRLPWSSGSDRQEKVQLTAAELGSLRSELADLEERAAHLKARLEHIDEILLSARLSGYLYIRTRWAALPGEPPPIDDTEVDDWLPRFVVLHGICVFFFLISTDLSPLDSALLSDIVEVGSMPSFTREDEGTRYCFYIMTRHGLRYECSHNSKVQVDSWLSALQSDCNLGSDLKVPNGSSVEK